MVHSWTRPRTISPVLFSAIAEEFTRVLPALAKAGAELANPHGYEQPEITPEFIGFNGVAHCGHIPNPAIRLPWPKNAASGIGSNQGITSGSLPFRCCNGDCSYESLWWERCVPEERAEGERAGNFTKTAFRPYDLAVNAFLLIAKHHLGSELFVSTDGEGAQWKDASELCKRELGYSAEAKIELGLLLLNQPGTASETSSFAETGAASCS